MTGADLFVSELQARGVTWISALCGNGLDPLLAAGHRAGIRLVDTRNEQAAAYMAECWGRLSRQVGVCAVSSGVAHVNALTGVLNAHFDGAPMLLITGASPLRTAGMGHFQDLDHVALAAPLCKYARVVDVPERIPQFLHEAFTAALGGRPGPVHLTLPVDVQSATVQPSDLFRTTTSGESPSHARAPKEQMDQALAFLTEARRPIVVAGSGCFYAGAESALRAFIGDTAIPVVVPIWDRGVIGRPFAGFMGVIGAATGGPRLLADADLVLMLGAAADYRVGYLQPPALSPKARIVRVDVDAARLGTGAAGDLAVHADPRSFLEQLRQGLNVLPRFDPWLEEAQRRRDRCRAGILDAARRDGVRAIHIVDALRETLTDDTLLVVDGGCIGQWFHQLLCDCYPGHTLTCGASGVVGFGIAGAMAAKVGWPDRPVVLLSGDGSATFTIAELECASRQGLPFVAIVADNESWNIVEIGHHDRFDGPIASHLGPIRFDMVAQGFGARGVRVTDPEEIAPAIREGLASDRPTLIHVPIAPGIPGRP